MMQASDWAHCHNLASLRRFDRPSARGILGEGEVGSSVVVVREVASQKAAQMALAQDDHMVETLSPYRADESFHEGTLAWAAGDPAPMVGENNQDEERTLARWAR